MSFRTEKKLFLISKLKKYYLLKFTVFKSKLNKTINIKEVREKLKNIYDMK